MELKIKSLHKSYGKQKVISGLNMDFSSEGIHCLFGPSGCGKTTLVNILAGVIPYDSGDIQGFNNKSFSYIFQEERLLPWATVEKNIKFVLESYNHKGDIDSIVDNYLSLVDLEEFKNYYPKELSGGMKQRVSIARALAYDGDILIMDEPFKGLHLNMKKTLMDYIIDYWHRKKGLFILITHDADEALCMANYIHVLEGPPLTLKKEIVIDEPPGKARSGIDKIQKYREMLEDKITE
ncbi:ABC transporter ATP-binding protein [Alkaliphilus pronyensis]|uniref:ABC transporter ATP-binding protein n=1 Tax=Alkaliphilus pronyensis TaxID=1482732 RepID=A0A6I0FB77_9FIRM|nr:ABC transporter ATP-binding protein [Alkaliphilus pronyensis]KAB3536054.1 ABC transporter ATP-binding protein [Alkaliphilus pronyensis]